MNRRAHLRTALTGKRPAGGATSYPGHCAVCGFEGTFAVLEAQPVDREFKCGGCKRTLRFRDEAQVIVDEYGDGRQLTIRALLELDSFRALHAYHVGSTGPTRRVLSQLEHYVESRFDPARAMGEVLEDGFRNEDLQQLSLPTASLDLVVSNHVMEHVPDPFAAFAEIHRVLRPGGRMIHSIPTRFPFPDACVARASLENGELVQHHPERFHNSPEGEPSLVFTDFGADLRPRLTAMGFDVSIRRPHLQIADARRNVVLVGRRLDGAAAGREPDAAS